MRRIYIASVVLCVLFYCLTLLVEATTDSNGREVVSFSLYTPRGSTLTGSITYGELTEAEKAAANNVSKKYTALGAVNLGEATLRYNCHALAWLEQDPTKTPCNLNSPLPYVDDGSYEEISEPEPGCLVIYYARLAGGLLKRGSDGSVFSYTLFDFLTPSHSGIVTEVPEGKTALSDITVVSKWGRDGLFSHKGDVCPYAEEPATTVQWNYPNQGVWTYEGFLEVRYYRFNEDNYRALTLHDETIETAANGENGKEGLWRDLDGEIRFYAAGEAQYVGLVQDAAERFYYIGENKVAVRNCEQMVSEFRSNRLLPSRTWTFGADGAMTDAPELLGGANLRNGLVRYADGTVCFLEDGEPTFVGLVQSDAGDYYFIGTSGQAVAGMRYTVSARYTNGLLPAGAYLFDRTGKITNVPELLAGENLTNGLIRTSDGRVQYLKDGKLTFAGLVRSNAGDYYFIGPSGRAVTDTEYTFTEAYANGLLPAGTYLFDADGKIQQVPTLLGGENLSNGLVRLPDGKVQYFKDGSPIFAGLVRSDAGDYYFISSAKVAVTNTTYGFTASYANGLLPAGTYRFDKDGKMIDIPVLLAGTDFQNGLVAMPDGRIQYMENGAAVFKGLTRSDAGDYYFIGYSRRALTDTEYTFTEEHANGLLPAGTYTFGEDGRITELPELLAGTDFLNGLVRLPDGTVKYLVDGEPTYAGVVRSNAGDYYFISSSLQAVRNTDYAFVGVKTNGLLPAGKYHFDAEGKITKLPELLAGTDYLNGLVRMPDGKIQYFQEGRPIFAGLVKSDAGDYYYISETRNAVVSTTVTIGEEKANGLLPAGTYSFDETGRLVTDETARSAA